MTLKQKRLLTLIGGGFCLCLAAGLVAFALRDNIVFFHDPSEILAGKVPLGQSARVGGLVVEGSFKRLDDKKVSFDITDTLNSISVSYEGLLPDLFREGQGVVADGIPVGPKLFEATRILAKHDENYMPTEVVDSLKSKGQWKPDQTSGMVSRVSPVLDTGLSSSLPELRSENKISGPEK